MESYSFLNCILTMTPTFHQNEQVSSFLQVNVHVLDLLLKVVFITGFIPIHAFFSD